MILGSIYVTAGAIAAGRAHWRFSRRCTWPFLRPGRYCGCCKPAVALLAGIPSVIYGLFGLTVLVPFVRDVFGGQGNLHSHRLHPAGA